MFALSVDAIDADRALRFAEGGTGGDATEQLSALLFERWPQCYLVVEKALASPADPFLSKTDLRIITCHDEVYAIWPIASDPAMRARTIRAADSTSLYVAAVVSTVDNQPPRCPPDELHQERLTIHLLATGAYDGEGFVCCEVG